MRHESKADILCGVVPAHKAIPAVLAEVLKKAPLCPEKVEFAWRAAVGPAMARVTRVSLDHAGVLHVTSSEPHWATEVKRSSKLILARLETMLGADVVRKLHAR
jgi:predicted nucleic acid-binding Zn ribbon protein